MRDSEYFLKAMNDIDDKFINEAFNADYKTVKKQNKIISFPVQAKRFIGVAAALVVLVGGIAILSNPSQKGETTSFDSAPKSNEMAQEAYEANGIEDIDAEKDFVESNEAPSAATESQDFIYPQQIQEYTLYNIVKVSPDSIDIYYKKNSSESVCLRVSSDIVGENTGINKNYSDLAIIDGVVYKGEEDKIFIAEWIQNDCKYYFYPNVHSLEEVKVFIEEIQNAI